MAFILISIVVGILSGLFLPDISLTLSWMGELFLQMLQLLVVPLILTSMIAAIGGLGDVRHLRKTGLHTLLYYMATTALAVALGLLLVNLIQPGVGFEAPMQLNAHPETVTFGQAAISLLKEMFPPNIFAALSQNNILALIIFSLVFGAILTTLGEGGRKLLALFATCQEAIMKMVHLVLYIAPLGIFSLIAAKLAAEGGLKMLQQLGSYAGCVLLGLSLHAFVTLPLLLYLFTGRSPLHYAATMSQALTTAFATASSSATLPVTLEGTLNAKVSPRISQFVLPLGATLNMDGTALYEAIAALFIAQTYGIELGLAQQTLLFLTATLASIGAAGIPEAGLVTMVLVLTAVGLPIEGISLILAIDWLLDRCRTTVNVWGDAVGAAIINTH